MLPVVSQTALPSTLLADLNAARTYAQQSLSEATRTAYVTDWRAFEGWCTDRGIEALPASSASVAAFLAAMAERGLRPATIARRCAAVRHFHRLAGIDPLPTDAAIVKTTVKGLRRSLGAAQAKKAPATAPIAKRIADALPDDSLKRRRDRAMVMLGFAGAFRKSEVVALNVEGLEFCDEGVRVTIRRSKTDQEAEGQTIAVLRGAGPFCPVRLLREWLDAAGIIDGALFRQVPKGGKRVGARLGGRAYYDVIKQRCCPRSLHSEGFSVMEISGLPRGFSTRCLRFTSGVATTHARLASGGRARLYRKGVEPSGSLQKVSDHTLILLFWIYPGARRALLHLSYSYATAVWTGVTRDTRPTTDVRRFDRAVPSAVIGSAN